MKWILLLHRLCFAFRLVHLSVRPCDFWWFTPKIFYSSSLQHLSVLCWTAVFIRSEHSYRVLFAWCAVSRRFGHHSVLTSARLDGWALGRGWQTRVPCPPPSLSCNAVGSTSSLVLVSWHRNRLVMSGVVPPTNQVPLRPHYSHFYLLHAAAVHHLMMLDPASDGAKAGGELLVLLPHLKFRPVFIFANVICLLPYFTSLWSCFGRCFLAQFSLFFASLPLCLRVSQ